MSARPHRPVVQRLCRTAGRVNGGAAKGLHEAGVMDTKTMREFDALCLTPVRNLSAAQIRRLRMRNKASQAVFAAYPAKKAKDRVIPMTVYRIGVDRTHCRPAHRSATNVAPLVAGLRGNPLINNKKTIPDR